MTPCVWAPGTPGLAVGGGGVMVEYIIPAAAGVVVAIIEAVAARDRRNAKKEREWRRPSSARTNWRNWWVLLIQGNCAIALGEAGAGGRRIPDAHCNGGHGEGRAEIRHGRQAKNRRSSWQSKASTPRWRRDMGGKRERPGLLQRLREVPTCFAGRIIVHRIVCGRGLLVRCPYGSCPDGRTRRGCWGDPGLLRRGTIIAKVLRRC